MMKKLFPLTSLSLLAALVSVQTSHAQATGFADVAVVSATMGVNDGRLCTGEFSRGDIGCAANAPSVSRTTGYLGVGTANPSTTLTVSGTTYTGFLQLDAKTGAAAPSSFQGGHWSASGTAVYYNGGSVGLGTSSPDAKLTIVNSSFPSLQITGSSGFAVGMRIQNNHYAVGTNWVMAVDSLGGFSFQHNAVDKFWFGRSGSDNGTFTGTLSQTSDRRIKSNIRPLQGPMGLEGLLRLNPVTFERRDQEKLDHEIQLGLIAQEVRSVFPELVSGGSSATITLENGQKRSISDVLAVNYTGLIPPIIKAVQELKAENDALRAAYAADIKDLQTELEALKRALPAAARH